ncbi:uncharacterized protein TM35_000054470 [Trypanosoma theileri]|uniref:Kinesin n=1 Tax=Trypanosoma theileri TaxID=67003 RepID=A0A1X0P4T9_9TRYP|nr:uncharacterized protein TM35_000054470 [Trypanosoma theileri]ORC91851.1 hypothetical protein TM35_000054470 [Trypanosoma theileri]
MIVVVREYGAAEVRRLCGGRPLAALYTWRLEEAPGGSQAEKRATAVSVMDPTDARARRTVNLDVYAANPSALFAAVRPALRAILPPIAAPQVVIVVDGTRLTRTHALLHTDDGLLPQCWRLLHTTPDFNRLLATVHIAVVELDDHNKLRDITPITGASAAAAMVEPDIIEDDEDHFTSVEDASYLELRSEEDLMTVIHHVDQVASPDRHQIFSFILTFKKETGLPNSTIQFISFTLSEVGKGIRSTRHCVTTAASLIESRSPSITFAGTKLSFLLKPALLKQQSGVWISCFAPSTPPEETERETFREAFCIAYTASRVYSSRIGVEVAEPTFQVFSDLDQRSLFNSYDEQAEILPRVNIPTPYKLGSSSSPLPLKSPNSIPQQRVKDVTHRLKSIQSPYNTSREVGDVGLINTPYNQRPVNISDRVGSEEKRSGHTNSIQKNRQQQTNRLPYDRCSSLERHPYNCSARYELETYKRVMEPAMDQLRRDIQHYMKLLEDARRQIRMFRRGKEADEQNKEMEIEVHQLRKSLSEATRHCKFLETEFARREEELRAKVTEVQAQFNEVTSKTKLYDLQDVSLQTDIKNRQHSVATQTHASLSQSPQQSHYTGNNGLVTSEKLQTQQQSPVPLQSNDTNFTTQWLEVVGFHQRELEEHVSRERAYRSRIMSLEEALSERDAEIARINTELMQREQQFSLEELKNQQKEHERQIERRHAEGLEQLRAEMLEAQRVSTATEHRLEMCLRELKEERKLREASEAELRQLQTTCAQRLESGTAKEMMLLLKETYERQFHHLQREVEELRQRSVQTTPRETTPRGSNSVASTPRRNSSVRQTAGGMLSPAVERDGNSFVPARIAQKTEDSASYGVAAAPSGRVQVAVVGGDKRQFEDFMNEESSYTFHLPKALERIRS